MVIWRLVTFSRLLFLILFFKNDLKKAVNSRQTRNKDSKLANFNQISKPNIFQPNNHQNTKSSGNHELNIIATIKVKIKWQGEKNLLIIILMWRTNISRNMFIIMNTMIIKSFMRVENPDLSKGFWEWSIFLII